MFKSKRFWNNIPDAIRDRIVQLAMDEPDLSPRELATRFTDTESYVVSELISYLRRKVSPGGRMVARA